MTPKEKATQLIDKMLYCYQGHIDKYTAKQCALIVVDELIDNGIDDDKQILNYWKEVKQEINK